MDLDKLSVFQDIYSLPEENRKRLQTLITWFEAQQGNSLFQQGAPGLGVYLLAEGKVKQYRLTRGGKKMILELSGPGALVGTEALFNKENHVTTAEVVSENAEVGFLERNSFFDFMKQNLSLIFNLAARVATKTMAYKLKLVETSHRGSKERICRLLLAGNDRGLDLSRKELAQLCGISYKTTVQILGELEERDLVETSEHLIKVLDEEALQELADEFPLDLGEEGLL